MDKCLRTALVSLYAALSTAVLCSVLQTQMNLHELHRMGVETAWSLRAGVTAEDLLRFGPVMFGFALAAVLLALPMLAGLRRLGVEGLAIRLIVHAATLALVLVLLRNVVPMPAIAATRSLTGLLWMSLCGLAAGGVSHRLSAYLGGRRPRRRGRAAMLVALGVLLPAVSFLLMRPVSQQPLPPLATGYQTSTLAEGLNRPWSLVELPDGRWLVSEMGGRLQVVGRDGVQDEVDLQHLQGFYQQGRSIGLMDLALSPDYHQDQRLYLTQGYRNDRGVGVRLVRGILQQSAGGLSLDQIQVLFESTPKPRDGNNGGRLAFLDKDTLLMTVGDGSARREQAQNPHTSLGKVMRIKLARTTDSAAEGHAATASTYTSGHRNPQGIVRDPASGNIYVSEHGPRGGDELNLLRAGGNYGWPIVSHGIDYPFARVSPFPTRTGMEDPQVVWSPSIAPSGLTIYKGSLFPGWDGDLLVPALRERGIRRLVREQGRVVRQERLLSERNERIRDVRVAADGSIHVLTDGVDGKLLRLVPDAGA